MKPVFVALTAQGHVTAQRAAAVVGGEAHVLASAVECENLLAKGEKTGAESVAPDRVFTDTADHLRALFSAGTPIVGICAAGILIRVLAPLLSEKRREPPVLAMSEEGGTVVPLLGGHHGANDLTRKLAAALGAYAAVTTAGDNRFGVALDAPPEGWTLANPEDAKPVMAALLAGAEARLEGYAPWLEASHIPFGDDGDVRLVVTTRAVPPPSEMGEGDHAQHGGRGGHKRGARHRPPPPPSAVPLPRFAGEEPAPAANNLTLIYHPRRLAIGIGSERGADPAEAIALVREALEQASLASAAVALVASLDLKADEPAVLAAADALGVPARFFTADRLEAETPRLKTPSEAVFREVGCHGVAEGAALAAVGADGALVVPKRKSARVTCAIAEAPEVIDARTVGRARGRLAVVGIGPGAAEWLTPEARRLLETSDAAVGYSLYLDLVAPLIAHAERFDSPLGSEEERVRQALALAAEGRSVALVSSGDAGIYALATLVFECLDDVQRWPGDTQTEATGAVTSPLRGGRSSQSEARASFGRGSAASASSPPPEIRAHHAPRDPSNFGLPSKGRLGRTGSPDEPGPVAAALPEAARRVEIVVAPGVSAMQAAAARAGAPLGHDFCAISLSDLLTPWETITARIQAAAEGDFVVAFYNPVSARRRTQLAEAKRILSKHRPPDTPVIIARNLGREGETVTTVPLLALSVEMVDMLTLVIVGASTTRQAEAAGRTWTYTPRGYEKKRELSPPPTQRGRG